MVGEDLEKELVNIPDMDGCLLLRYWKLQAILNKLACKAHGNYFKRIW